MKRVPLRTIEFDLDGQPRKLDYAAEFRSLLRHPKAGAQGLDIEEIGRALTAMSRIVDGAPYADLEDAEHAMLLERINAVRWGFAAAELVDMVMAVREAKEE
jgi:hypothetical protein